MALSHALPAAYFAAPRSADGRREPLSFASLRETAATSTAGIAPNQAGSHRERRWTLVLVALAHVAAIIGITRLADTPAPAPATPISVALIELPVPLPAPPVAPPANRPKTTPVARAPQPRAPAPAPTVESASAIRGAAVTLPAPPVAPRALPANPPPPAPGRATPEAPPAVVAARFDAAYLSNPAPVYPPLSRRLREEGKALLHVQVSAEGLPAKVELAESSGFGRLDSAARESVLRWHFVPARQDGHAVDAWVIVPIIFKLQGQ